MDLPPPDVPTTSALTPYEGSVSSVPSLSLTQQDLVPSQQAGAAGEIVGQYFADQLGYTRAVIRLEHHVGGLLDGGQGVGHGCRAFADAQEGMIVLGVADAHGVVQRDVELFQRRLETGRLVHAARQHHHGALVEDHLQLEAQIADRFQHHFFIGLPGGDDAPTHGNSFHATALQFLDETRARAHRPANAPRELPAGR